MEKTLKKLCLLLFVVCGIAAPTMAEVVVHTYATVSRNVNLRTGPGKQYPVVRILPAGTKVMVSDTVDNTSFRHVYVGGDADSDDYVDGYVSDRYLRNYCKVVKKVSKFSQVVAAVKNWWRNIGVAVGVYVNVVFAYIYGLPWYWSLLLFLACFAASALIIFRYHLLYLHCKNILPALLLLVVSCFATISEIAVLSDIEECTDAKYIFIYLGMILVTGSVMVYSAWCIKLTGMEDGLRRDFNHYNKYRFGVLMGNVTYLIMILSVMQILNTLHTNFIPMPVLPNKVWVSFVVLPVLIVLNIVIVYVVAFYVIRYLFHTANASMAYLISIILPAEIFSYEGDMLMGSLKGVLGGVTYAIFIITAYGTVFYVGIRKLREYRCPCCHSYCTTDVGVTDLGTYRRTRRDWIRTDDIKPSWPGVVVKDGEQLVETTETVQSWRSDFHCYECGENWNIIDSKVIDSVSRILEKRWTEYG